MRPIYETAASLSIEGEMAAWLERAWRCKLEKLPRAYKLDYAAVRDHKIAAWVELKRRNRALAQFPTVFLSLQKIMAAHELYRVSRLPNLFVVQFDDCYAFAVLWRKRHGPRKCDISQGHEFARLDDCQACRRGFSGRVGHIQGTPRLDREGRLV